MTAISKRFEELDSENYSNEELLILFEFYAKASEDEGYSKDMQEISRISVIALKRIILNRMVKGDTHNEQNI